MDKLPKRGTHERSNIFKQTKQCAKCNKEKSMHSFWIKEDDVIIDICKTCKRKQINKEATLIALNLIKKLGYEYE